MVKNKGQTLVEYVLLLIVVAGVASLLLKHPWVKKNLVDGGFVTLFQKNFQESYRHGLVGAGSEVYPVNYQSTEHFSYRSASGTRFFGPRNGYP
jgi:hypothetical protein